MTQNIIVRFSIWLLVKNAGISMAFVRGVPPSQMSNASLTKVYCPISRCPAAIRKVVDRSLKLSSVWSRLKKNCKRMGSAPNKKPIRLTRLHLEFWGDAEKYIGHLGAIVSIALGGPFLIGAVAPFSLARYRCFKAIIFAIFTKRQVHLVLRS